FRSTRGRVLLLWAAQPRRSLFGPHRYSVCAALRFSARGRCPMMTPQSSTQSPTPPTPGSADEPERIRKVLVPPQDRPAPASALTACLAYGWRALLKIKHLPEQLIDVTIFPVMMTLMFTFIFGGAIGGSVDNYVQFLIPGIFVQTLIMITMYTGLTLNRDFSKGVFDRFRSLPVWRPAQLVGALLGDQIRYLLAGTIILTVGFFLGLRPEGGMTGVIAAFMLLLVFSFSLSWVWTAVSLAVRTEQAAMGVSMFVMMPLVFASNIFVDPSTMPTWLQRAVDVNPVSIVVTTIREMMAGTYSLSFFGLVALCCGVLIMIFGPMSMFIYYCKSKSLETTNAGSHIDEPCLVYREGQFYGFGGTVMVLCHNQLSFTGTPRFLVIHVLTVQQNDHNSVLFNRPGFTQIQDLR